MSQSKFFNLYERDMGYSEFTSIEAAHAGVSSSRPWLGTIELVDGRIRWHPNPAAYKFKTLHLAASPSPALSSPADLTDAQIREAREVIRVARVLQGGGA